MSSIKSTIRSVPVPPLKPIHYSARQVALYLNFRAFLNPQFTATSLSALSFVADGKGYTWTA